MSAYAWNNRAALLTKIADRLPSIPLWQIGKPAENDKERFQWLETKLLDQELVFLLDAVDQTRETLVDLGDFLNSLHLLQSPVIVTGRRHVQETQSPLWDGASWQTLRTDGFDVPSLRNLQNQGRDFTPLRIFLRDRAGVLMHEDDTYEKRTEHRKDDYIELLKVPVLAELLRRIAGQPETLKGLKNREAVYAEAIEGEEGLLAKNHPKHLYSTGNSPNVGSPRHAGKLYRELAWGTLLAQNLTGEVDQESLDRFIETRGNDFLRELDQYNVIIKNSLVRGSASTSYVWRHLSYL